MRRSPLDENETAVVTVAAEDSDADDDITGYAIDGGADQGLFEIDGTSGALTFKTAPDFEAPTDSDTNGSYVVEVTATSGTGEREKTATQTITVTVSNADEGRSGTVTIDDTSPVVGDALTASTANVADPDGLPDPFEPDWQWYRTPDGGSETEISGAASATYTVVAADLGAALTAKASWTDNGGFTNTLVSAPTSEVAVRPVVTIVAAGDGASVTEGTDAVFTLSRTGPATSELTVTVAVSDPEAVLTTTSPPSSVTFAAGEADTMLALATDDDDTDDTDGDVGTVTVTLVAGSGYEVGTANAATVTVTDNDVPVDLVLSVPATVAEAAGKLTVTVTATTAEDAPPERSVGFVLTRVLGEGTAGSGADHVAVSEAVLLQPQDFDEPVTVDGQQRYRAVWTHDVRIENDTVVEADETLVLQLGPHYSIGPPAFHTVHDGVDPVQATVTIIDDDPPVDFTADPTPNSVVLTWGHADPGRPDLTSTRAHRARVSPAHRHRRARGATGCRFLRVAPARATTRSTPCPASPPESPTASSCAPWTARRGAWRRAPRRPPSSRCRLRCAATRRRPSPGPWKYPIRPNGG